MNMRSEKSSAVRFVASCASVLKRKPRKVPCQCKLAIASLAAFSCICSSRTSDFDPTSELPLGFSIFLPKQIGEDLPGDAVAVPGVDECVVLATGCAVEL